MSGSDITPCIDVSFKKIFGTEENKDLLISLINSIVLPEDRIDNIVLLNPYNLQDFEGEKTTILDIKARGESELHKNKMIEIEIQVVNEYNYEKRALHYWSKSYSDQIKEDEDFDILLKTIGIHFLNFNLKKNPGDYHNVFRIKESSRWG